MISVRAVTKKFGDFVALDDVSLEIPDGSLTALLGPSRLGQVDAAADHRRARGRPTAGAVEIHGEDATRVPAQRRGIGFVFQHYAAFKHMTVRDNVAFGLKIRKRPKERDRRARRRAARRSSASPATRSATRRSSPAASASAWRSPARSRSSRRCCCSTSRSARSTPRSAPSCASGCASLHDEVHVTTVLVTHDQEEAMAIADQIAVMDNAADRAGRRAARALRPAGRTRS